MMSTQDQLQIYLFNNHETKLIDVNDTLVEQLVLSISADIGINPIGRHLLAIYHTSSNTWLSNHDKISGWKYDCKFELRIRFRPFNINKLKNLDITCFKYYFYQMRHDFLNGKFDNDDDDVVYGLAVVDMLREILEKRIPIKSALDSLNISKFLPVPFRNKLKLFFMKNEIEKKLFMAWNNCNENVEFVMQSFMESFCTNLKPDYGSESYQSLYDLNGYPNHVIVQLIPYDDKGVTIRSINDTPLSPDSWIPICHITDICFVSINCSKRTVEISRKNGIPCYFIFNLDLAMKSFVSLLDGYYRLSEKWCFSICKDMALPSLIRNKLNKCHGPIGLEFAHHKLREHAKVGTFLLRESMKNFDEYKLDVMVNNGVIKTYKIKNIDGQLIIYVDQNSKINSPNEYLEKFGSLSELVNDFVIRDDSGDATFSLLSCLPPSEYDTPENLLLCKHDSHFLSSEKNEKKESNNCRRPHVIRTKDLKSTNTKWKSNSEYAVRLALLRDEKVVVKEFKNDFKKVKALELISSWVHLKNDSLVSCIGITLDSPFSLIQEYIPLGPLDVFLIEHQMNLKVVDLIESVTYLSRALWYLQENGIFHGHIRCHNLLVSNFSSNSLRVKLSDPLSESDWYNDKLWLPYEYLTRKEINSSFDVWSFATTVWQIFSFGCKPDSIESVELLAQPFACPDAVWNLIWECWSHEPSGRKTPQSIVRDVSQLLYEVYNSRRSFPNNYAHLEYKKGNLSSMIKSLIGSTTSLSSSVMSSNTTMTTIAGNELSLGAGDITINDMDGCVDDLLTNHYTTNEPWVIEANQLRLGKVLGQGCYGEVMMANLTQWDGLKQEIVAVKRIKTIASEDALRDMKREIEIMKKLEHTNIVEIKGYVEEPQLMLVMEYVELGSMLAYLKMHRFDVVSCSSDTTHSNSVLPLPLIKFASDIANGMQYLESKSIVHRDLAARNILVASHDHVKISDFGLAQQIDPHEQCYTIKTERELPLRWYAPELKYGRFSHKSDIWSFGVVLWEMFSFGENPTYPNKIADCELFGALESGIRLNCPEKCPAEVYQIMLECWRLDSHQRPTFTQLKSAIETQMTK